MTKAQEKRCDDHCKKMKLESWRIKLFKLTIELFLSVKFTKKEQAAFDSEYNYEDLELLKWFKTGKKPKTV